jgi:hypothetical protein
VVLFPWSLLRIVGITEDSMHPDVQDPDTQISPDAWIMEIRDYMKDSILPDEHVSTERMIRVAKRYTMVEGDLYRCGTNDMLLRFITQEDGCEFLA